MSFAINSTNEYTTNLKKTEIKEQHNTLKNSQKLQNCTKPLNKFLVYVFVKKYT